MTSTAEPQELLFALDDKPSGWGALKPREQRFLLSYVQHGNGAKAAREAGYSDKAAKQIGAELLTRHDLLKVYHQMSYQLGCTMQNRIVRQEQLATQMFGIACDVSRKPSDRISAARAVVACDGLLSGLMGHLKLRVEPMGEDGGHREGDFTYTAAERARIRAEWKIAQGRDVTPEAQS